MSTATLDDPANAADYRAVHTGAIVGALCSIVSLFYPLMVASTANIPSVLPMIGVPLGAMGLSLWSWSFVKRNSDLYTGAPIALVGVLIAMLSLVGGTAYGAYVYTTEVPDGYARTSFLEMKPGEKDLQGQQPIPKPVQELLGKKVFIKGYIRPDSTQVSKNIKDFLLVRDNNECCFGDMNKVQFYDQVDIDLIKGNTIDMTRAVVRVGGELTVRPGNPRKGEPALVYGLQADYIQ